MRIIATCGNCGWATAEKWGVSAHKKSEFNFTLQSCPCSSPRVNHCITLHVYPSNLR